jgi:hypothetical protein
MSSQGCQLYVLKVSYGSIQPFLSSSNLSRYLLNDLRTFDFCYDFVACSVRGFSRTSYGGGDMVMPGIGVEEGRSFPGTGRIS